MLDLVSLVETCVASGKKTFTILHADNDEIREALNEPEELVKSFKPTVALRHRPLRTQQEGSSLTINVTKGENVTTIQVIRRMKKDGHPLVHGCPWMSMVQRSMDVVSNYDWTGKQNARNFLEL